MANSPASARTSSRLSRADIAMGSGHRFSSLFGSPLPSPMPGASLPAINNMILMRHIDAVNTLQQQLLEMELRCRPDGQLHTTHEEDDAPLPSTRYIHMSEMLVAGHENDSFEEWQASMEQQVQQRLGNQQPLLQLSVSVQAPQQLETPKQLSPALQPKRSMFWRFATRA